MIGSRDHPTAPAPPVTWNGVPHKPIALVLLPLPAGYTTVAYRDEDGTLYGCRQVVHGAGHDGIVRAWIDRARASDLAVDDRRIPAGG